MTGEFYALKVISKRKMSNDDADALKMEIDVLRQVDHPNIIKLHEVFEDKSHFYLVLELM